MCSMPGITMSPAYCSAPLTLLGASSAADVVADEEAPCRLSGSSSATGEACR